MTIKTVIFVSLFIANIATAQPLDLQRGKRNYQLVLEGKRKIDSFSQAEINEVLQVLQLQQKKIKINLRLLQEVHRVNIL